MVPKLWPGATFVIIGGGSSLTLDDVIAVGDAQARSMVRERADRPAMRVIAIKEAYLLAPWADVLYACDPKWWQFYAGAPTFDCRKYTLAPQPVAWPGVTELQNTGDEGLELDPTGIRTGRNSGAQAINLAVHLGAAKIILLGFDCSIGPSGEQNWFGRHQAHVASPYPIFLQMFGTMAAPLKAAGVEVVNASRFTILNAFPRVSLEEALS